MTSLRPSKRLRPARSTASLLALGVVLVAPGQVGAARLVDADLGVTLSGPSRVTVGQIVSYVVTVADNGPDQATGVSVSLSVSGAKASVGSVSSSTAGIQCSVGRTGHSARCVVGTLPVSSSAQMRVTVKVSGPGTLTATAKSREHEYDPLTGNSEARAETAVAETDAPTAQPVYGSAFDEPFTTHRTFAVSWRAEDTGSGVARYDVRTREGASTGALGSYRTWLSGTSDRRATFTGHAGATYCFSVRATDWDGNTSSWTADRCTSVLLPATAARRTGAWLPSGPDGGLRTRDAGSTLAFAGLVARRIVVSALVGPAYGVLRVSWDGRTIRTLSLQSRSRSKRLFTLVGFRSPRRGRLVLTVVSDRRTVAIDALGIAKL